MNRPSLLDRAARFQTADRIARFGSAGIDLIIGRREGYRIYDIDGRPFWDLHLNGGTYTFGHRHPQLRFALSEALDTLDIGNHHFVSPARVELAEAIDAATLPGRTATVFASGGSEAVDIAVKSARWATGRRKVVALSQGYHGRTGISGAAGDDNAARYFLSDAPDAFVKVPFNDVAAMRAALSAGDVACVLIETIPATYGFPTPDPGYLQTVKSLCKTFGSAYVADEVQTGLGRTGRLWGWQTFEVEPDIIILGKGLSGGLYPIAGCVLTDPYSGWLGENGWGHVSTFGGAEPGCRVGSAVLSLAQSPDTIASARRVADRFAESMRCMLKASDYLVEIRQTGLVVGLVFDGPSAGIVMMRALYDQGIWAIFAGFDERVLQWKPGALLSDRDISNIMTRFEAALQAVDSGRYDDLRRAFLHGTS